MNVALVPVKSLAASKSRLLPQLGFETARQLSVAMLADVLEALLAVPELTRVAVVTPDDEVVLVEADLSRPPRAYGIRESYTPGDRIEHPTLGMGVVQALAGAGKISVLFNEKTSLLVHERI